MSRWVSTAALRAYAFLVHARWIVLSLSLAIAGVVGIIVALPPWLNVTLALVSVALLFAEIHEHMARLRETQFVERSTKFEDVSASIEGSDRFRLVDTGQGHVIIDSAATSAISCGTVTASLTSSSYVIPQELREVGVAFRRRRVAQGATYNGRILGLDSDLGATSDLASTHWRLVPARYWDHLATDIFAMSDVLRNGRLIGGLGRDLFIDRTGRVRDLGDSWLVNGIGTSVVALTSDGRVVAVSQSNRNESSRGMLAPSGSGSLEPADLRGETTITMRELAANGALRELSEETGILADDVAQAEFLGFGRWLEKAAKPELFTVALLNIDSHEVRRRQVPRADRPYTLGVEVLRLEHDSSLWNPDDPRTLFSAEIHHWRFSVPLVIGLQLMASAVHVQGSVVSSIVAKAIPTVP